MRFKVCLALLSLLLVSACTEAELASHVVKQMPDIMTGSKNTQGYFKVGNPYKVEGKWYRPTETYSFTETGIASWYGPNFHGKKTANGEIFDMNELTAAHRTLQLPSLVRVTNLENGRSLVVRVNDRGPFSRGRIIDLSKRAAELLGFKQKGTAKVKLQVLSKESRQIANAAKRGEDTRGTEIAANENRPIYKYSPTNVQQASAQGGSPVPQTATEQPVPGHIENGRFLPDPVVKQAAVSPSNIYVQIASLTERGKAQVFAQEMSNFGIARVYPAIVNGKQYYRVRLGPLGSVANADSLLSSLSHSGHSDAIIVVD